MLYEYLPFYIQYYNDNAIVKTFLGMFVKKIHDYDINISVRFSNGVYPIPVKVIGGKMDVNSLI